MKKLLIALAFSLLSQAAWAQNPTCPTRPFGDNTNACASTAFVTNAVAPFSNLNVLSSFAGATGDAQLTTALAAGVPFVQLVAASTFANTVPINLPQNFVIFCNGNTITQSANTPSVFTMGEGSQFVNCHLNGNGTVNTGDMIAITAGNNQRLINVDILNTQGYNVSFSANVGGNFQWIGGSFNRTTATNDAILLPAVELGTAGPRKFVGLDGNGSWMIDLNGGNFTVIEGGSMLCLDFRAASHYVLLHNTRVACAPTILGSLHQIRGTIFDAGVTLGAGATQIYIEAQPGLTITDSSGVNTNQIIPSASNTYTQYMAGGNTIGWQLLQAGSTAMQLGTNASNNPYIHSNNSLPIVMGNCIPACTDYWSLFGGVETVVNVAAPTSPSAGSVKWWTDSTDLRFHDKNSAGTIGTTVVSSSCSSGTWATSISTAGVIACGALAAGNFANPSASAGLTAVNGSATTAMRSDGAPAISQSIVPTWTGQHIFSTSGIPIVSNSTNSAQNIQMQAAGATTAFFGGAAGAPLFVQNPSGVNVVAFNFSGTVAASPSFTAQATGLPVIYGVAGSDTNINISLTPKGTTGIVNANSTVASTSKTTGSLTASGGLGVAGATFTDTLNIITVANAATTAALCWNSGTGLVTENAAVGTCTISDGRLKNIERPIVGALAKLLKIHGIYFTWKDQPKYGLGRQAGVIAQDVQKVFPELVSTDGEGKLSADYQRLTAPIIEALRELKAENDNIRAELRALKQGKRNAK